MTVEQIKEQIAALSQGERADVALYALRSLELDEEGDEKEIQTAWDDELKRRIAALRSGDAVEIPAEDFFARLREELLARADSRMK